MFSCALIKNKNWILLCVFLSFLKSCAVDGITNADNNVLQHMLQSCQQYHHIDHSCEYLKYL